MTPKSKTSSLYADAMPARRDRPADDRGKRKRLPAATHKFSIGQTVSYSPGIFDPPDGRGIYQVVRLLPAEGSGNQYRLQNETGGRERVACEGQLSLREGSSID